MADSQRPRLPDQRVGNEKPFVIESTVRGAAQNPTSARAVGYDPQKTTKGTATYAGSTSTLSDTAATWTNDQPNGLLLRVECAASGRTHHPRITDFVASTKTFTFTTLSEAVAKDDEYEVMGCPLMELAAVTVAANQTTVNANEAQHGYAGTRRLAIEFTYSATDVAWIEYEYEVLD